MTPRLGINVLEDQLDQATRFAGQEHLAIEVTAFAFPAGLDQGFNDRVRRHAALLSHVSPISVHGPFFDLYPVSPDPEIVAVTRRRHEQALDAAIALNAQCYVAHLNSLPQIKNDQYRDRFVRVTAEFWLPLAERAAAHQLTIVLENQWEAGPALQQQVVEAVAHPSLKASFDNGHALVFSDVPASTWIETLGSHLAHCHLHDNDGTYDHHWPIGSGKEDWPALFGALESYAPDALVIIECDDLEKNRTSLGAVRRMNLRP